MRVLLATRGSSGHLGPLVPFARACLAVGHEVLVAAQGRHRANVEPARLPCAPLGDLRDEDWMPLLADHAQLDFEAANARMVGEFFGRLDTVATLPALRRLVAEWAPDVIVRESWEYASVLVAELEGTPLARVGLGLGALEERSIGWAAPHLEPVRAELGLAPDPAGDRLRGLPYLTTLPAGLKDPGMPLPAVLHRFGNRPPDTAEPLPDWWPGNHDPLRRLTFGSVTAGEHLPYSPRSTARPSKRSPHWPSGCSSRWASRATSTSSVHCRRTSTPSAGCRRMPSRLTRPPSSAMAGTARRHPAAP